MTDVKISIITACYNSEKTLEHCINSVISQNYKNIEYILIDGGSNDQTLQIIKNYKNFFSRIIIEEDNGVYDAMNKGIEFSSGDIIGFLNSDDFFENENVVQSIARFIDENNLDGCYGDVFYVDKFDPNTIRRRWKSSQFSEGYFSFGWAPPHPTFYVKKQFYSKFGGFNLKYKIAADFELMLRFLEINKLKIKYLNKNLVHMRLGGISNKNYINVIKQNIEIIKILYHYKLPINPILFFIKKIKNRMKQFS